MICLRLPHLNNARRGVDQGSTRKKRSAMLRLREDIDPILLRERKLAYALNGLGLRDVRGLRLSRNTLKDNDIVLPPTDSSDS